MAEDFSFIDPSSFGGGENEGFNFKYCIISALYRISQLASKEMRGGYYEEKPSQDKHSNQPLLVYVTDTRDSYCNAVDNLYDMLHSHFDKIMDSAGIANEERLKELIKRTLNNTNADDSEIMHLDFYEDEDKLIIEQYRNAKYKLKRELFRALCGFLKRINYFDSITVDVES